jgi:hypothetical protein
LSTIFSETGLHFSGSCFKHKGSAETMSPSHQPLKGITGAFSAVAFGQTLT